MKAYILSVLSIVVLFITYNNTIAQMPICKKESYNNLKVADTLKSGSIRYTGEGNVCYTYTHYQIPFTPIYVLQLNKWFKHRHAPILKLGWWYVPFISRR